MTLSNYQSGNTVSEKKTFTLAKETSLNVRVSLSSVLRFKTLGKRVNDIFVQANL